MHSCLGTVRNLLDGSRTRACRRRRFADAFLDLIVSILGSFGDVRLMRLTERLHDLECLRVADLRERFQKTRVDARLVRGSLEKWIKNVGAFELRQVTDNLILS